MNLRDWTRWPAMAALGMLLFAPATWGGVSVSIDATTLNDVLSEIATRDVVVPISDDHSVQVQLRDLEITGFDPSAGDERQGYIRTNVTLEVPELGLKMKIAPSISMNVVREGETGLIELRFEEVNLILPLAGKINIAGMLPPTRFPSDNLWLLDGAAGEVRVKSRLEQIKMGWDTIRFDFAVDVLPGK